MNSSERHHEKLHLKARDIRRQHKIDAHLLKQTGIWANRYLWPEHLHRKFSLPLVPGGRSVLVHQCLLGNPKNMGINTFKCIMSLTLCSPHKVIHSCPVSVISAPPTCHQPTPTCYKLGSGRGYYHCPNLQS